MTALRKREEMPFVRQGKLHTPEGQPICAVASPAGPKTGWLDWLKTHKSFRYESLAGIEISVIKERRQGRSGEYFDYWYAHRHVFGQLVRVYLGKPEMVTLSTTIELTQAGLLLIIKFPTSDEREPPVEHL